MTGAIGGAQDKIGRYQFERGAGHAIDRRLARVLNDGHTTPQLMAISPRLPSYSAPERTTPITRGP